MRLLALLGLFLSSAALAQYEGARRLEVDGGVHVPVLTKEPTLEQFVQATYPPQAQAEGLSASVRLLVTIAADGTVSDASVIEPVGNGFDEAALEAVRGFKFTPAEVDHLPSPIQIEYVYHFELQVVDAGVALDAGPPPPPRAHLKGQLLARGSRSRIEGATVRCMNESAGNGEAISDAEGLFDLELNAGDCEVKVIGNEYEPFKTLETLAPNETAEVVYYVMPKVVGYETVVRGTREKKEVVRRSLERQELQKIPGTFGDPVRVIQNFPGVARAPFLSGALIVRGAKPSQTLTFMDGVEIPLLYHLGGGPSVVNGEFLDKIDFYPGGFGARYGRAVGGVVDVSTRRGAVDTLHAVVKIDIQDASLFVEVPITDQISLAGAVRRSYIDALLPLVLPNDPEAGTLQVLPVYWDYQVRADFGKKGAENTGFVMAFGSDDILKVIATGGGRNRDFTASFHTTFHRVVGNWTYRKGNTTLKLTPYIGYDLGRLDFGIAKISADQFEVGLREDLSVDVNDHLTLRAGADILYDHISGSAELPNIGNINYPAFPGAEPAAEVQKVSRVLGSFDGAVFLEAELKAGMLTVTPGIRASHAYLSRGEIRHAFDPRLYARLEPWERTQIKGSIGMYTQPPDAQNMEPPPFGTPTLTHEKAFQSSLGVAQKITDNLNIDLTAYYNRRYENVSSPGPTTRNPNGSVTTQRFANDGLGRAYGLEVMLRHEVTKNFFGWISYTFNRAEERTAGSDKGYRLTANDQTHILTFVGSYRLPFGFELGARFRYVTGVPKSPLLHPYDLYRADANSYTGTYGESRTGRVKDFHQLDLRLDKAFTFDRFTFAVFLDVQNVYNQKNVEGSFFDYRFRQEFEVPGIPFLPVLGIKASL
ncbi:MAG: TonB family protein [Myxococcaceae bacterium]|nr:TonB family protein [Myxococcaceae bacterium]